MIRIGFWGTPHLAARVLADLVAHPGFQVVFAVTNPDKPVGRSGDMKPSAVKEYAQTEGIPIFQPQKVRGNTEFLDTIRSFECDYFVVVAYGKILPLEVLDAPKKMCINVHGSILPRYRGASPIQSALLSGEKETGVTIMQMSEAMDEGDMILVEKIPIASDETSGTLFEKFGDISGKTLISALLGLESGELAPVAQDSSKATYCKKIEKEEGLIDWSKSAREIYQMWQAYTPWPGIYTMYEGKRLLLDKVFLYSPPEKWESEGVTQKEVLQNVTHPNPPLSGRELGTVIRLPDNKIGIVCGEWILTLEQVKLEWKKSQSIRDFVNGNQILGYRL